MRVEAAHGVEEARLRAGRDRRHLDAVAGDSAARLLLGVSAEIEEARVLADELDRKRREAK